MWVELHGHGFVLVLQFDNNNNNNKKISDIIRIGMYITNNNN